MKATSVRFRCPHCRSRLNAPARLAGDRRDCPACELPLVVPGPLPEDLAPVLVLVEGEESCRLGVAYRRGG